MWGRVIPRISIETFCMCQDSDIEKHANVHSRPIENDLGREEGGRTFIRELKHGEIFGLPSMYCIFFVYFPSTW
jgi:hypothetical protein